MRAVNIDEAPKLDRILIHAINGVGKSHMLASFLAHEKQYGKCLYVYVAGEPAVTSMANFDMTGVQVVEIDSCLDIPKVEKEYGPQHAIAFDSLAALNELADKMETGDLRAPGAVVKGGGVDGQAEWGKIKYHVTSNIAKLQKMSTIFMAACPSDKDTNEVTGVTSIAPGLVGKLSYQIVRRFSFVGYMEAIGINATKIDRQVSFHFRSDAVTRANVKTPFKGPIKIPVGTDGWPVLKGELLKSLL